MTKKLMQPAFLCVIVLLLAGIGCEKVDERGANESADRYADMVPVSEMWGEEEDAAPAEEDADLAPPTLSELLAYELQRAVQDDADDAGDSDSGLEEQASPPVAVQAERAEQAADEREAEIEREEEQQPTQPRSIRVATWHPPDVRTPEWIHPAIGSVRRGHRVRMFNHYDGDYKLYTADVIREIRRTHREGQPVTLILHHWINGAHVRGGTPAGIDPHGLLTHIRDRTESGLPGIWPDAGLKFWREANAHLISELKAAGVNLDFFALDTEVSPHPAGGPYSFEGSHAAIVADPRWRTEPLMGFDGLTAADIWAEPPLDNFRQLWMFVHLLGQQVYATAINEVLTKPLLEHYPDALISDYRRYTVPRRPETEGRRERGVAVEKIMEATGDTDYWLHVGIGNTASPAFYGHAWYQRQTDDQGRPIAALDAMVQHAEQLIERYGSPRLVAPWITTRARMDERIENVKITEDDYRAWIKSLVDLGIERFIWWPCGRGDPIEEQRLTVSAFEAAVAGAR